MSASVCNRRCNRKICSFYYVSGSLRPNHPDTALEKHSDNKLEKRHSLTPLMHIKMPVPEKRSQLSTLQSNRRYQSQSTQPYVPIQSSLPLIKHSHIMHTLPHKNPIFPLQPYNILALMFFLGQLRETIKCPRCSRHNIS